MSQSQTRGERLWQQLVSAEQKYIASRMGLFRARAALLESSADVAALVQAALGRVPERGTALRLLMDLDEATRCRVFPTLVEVASVGHADIQFARDVILSLNRQWLLDHLPAEVERVLSQGATGEEYRRLAELLDSVRSPYLATLVEKAAASADVDIREVAEDYSIRF